MRIIGRRALKVFWQEHRAAEQPLKSWYREAAQGHWESPADIKFRYQHASFIKGNRVVLSIRGNKYRLVVHVNYDCRFFCIGFVGTHAEYDQIDPEPI